MNLERPQSCASLVLAAMVASLMLTACEEEPVRVYQVPKARDIDPTGGREDATPPAVMNQPPTEAPAGSVAIDYDVPDRWTERPPGNMQVAAFTAGDDEITVAVTFFRMDFSPAANVNRWLRQLGREPVDAETAAAMIQPGPLGDAYENFLVELAGDERAMAVVMIRRAGGWWFIKMDGPRQPIADEMPAFREFVTSVNFEPEQP